MPTHLTIGPEVAGPYAIPCPYCGAKVGEWCRTASGHSGPNVAAHKQRIKAAGMTTEAEAERAVTPEEFEVVHAEVMEALAPPTPAEAAAERAAVMPTDAYDAESGGWLSVTPAMRALEEQARQAWALTKHAQAVIIREVFDRKLYLAAGYESRQAYCTEVLGLSRMGAHRLYSLATKLRDFLPSFGQVKQLSDGGVTPVLHPAEGEIAEVIQGTGVSKLYPLLSLDDELLDVLTAGETITLASGREVNLRELRDASKREAEGVVKELREQFSSKLSTEQERANLAEAELDVLRERQEEQDAEAERLRDLERQYGARQGHAEAQIKAIDASRAHYRKLLHELDRLDNEANQPEHVRREVASLLADLDDLVRRAERRLAPVVHDLD